MIKTCAVCDNIFETNHSNQIYCCIECSTQGCEWNYNYDAFFRRRFEVFKRDGFRCQYCGLTPQDGVKLQVDHIHPKSKGGSDDIENLVTACEYCNLGKSDVLLSQRIEKKQIESFQE